MEPIPRTKEQNPADQLQHQCYIKIQRLFQQLYIKQDISLSMLRQMSQIYAQHEAQQEGSINTFLQHNLITDIIILETECDTYPQRVLPDQTPVTVWQ